MENKTILLVEDDHITALMNRKILEKYRFNVVHAETGEKAVEIADTTPAIDLILMDIDLGEGIDGTKAAEIILTNRDIPLVFLSSHTEPEIVKKTQGITSYGYIVKNTGETVLIASIEMAFRLFESKEKIKEINEINSRRQSMVVSVLEILNKPDSLSDSIKDILDIIKKKTGIDAVGIRLQEGDDFPYYVQNGFSEDFIEKENSLVMRNEAGEICRDDEGNINLECTCGLVLSGKTDPANPLFTPGGSAWTNESLTILNIPLNDDLRNKPRNNCIHYGYSSIAIIPIKANSEIIGLLQLNDRRKNFFTPDMIYYFEGLSKSIAAALLRKKTEESLHESEKKYRDLVEASNSIILRLDRMGNITFFNKYAEEFFGFTKDEIEGRNVVGTIVPEYDNSGRNMRKMILDLAKKPHLYQQNENENTRKDGSRAWISWTNKIITDENKNVTEILCIGNDITERVKMEEAYIAASERLELAMSVANDGLWDLDIINNKVYFDPRFYTMAGYKVNEFPAEFKEWENRVHPADLEPCRKKIDEHLSGRNKTFAAEFRWLRKNGTWMWILGRGKVVERDENGNARRMVGTHSDITQRKQMEQLLMISENKYKKIFQNVQDVFYQTDLSGTIIEISPSIYKYSGYTREELIGTPVQNSYLEPEDRKNFVNKIMTDGQVTDYELHLKTKNNKLLIVSANSHFIKNAEGKPIGIEGSLRNITERKLAEEKINTLLKEKEIILKETHHRVKNNMNSIVSLLMLQAEKHNDESCTSILYDSAGRVQSMMMLYDKLYRSENYSELNISDFLIPLINEITGVIHSRVPVKTETDFQNMVLPPGILSPLGIIINELITNSMKHAFAGKKEGIIRVKSEKKGSRVTLTYSDNGRGIPEDFHKKDNQTFGMELVKLMVKQIRGSLKIEQTDGAKFVIEFDV